MYAFPTPFFNIYDTDTPASLALLDEADLQLCALSTEVSTPAFESLSLIHLNIVSDQTGLCGFPELIMRPLTSRVTNVLCIPM